MHLCLPLLLITTLASAEPARILFDRIGPYQTTIQIANADGTNPRPLLDSKHLDYNPAWSPDGKWIVFTSERDGSADLYRVHPDGTALERLTDNPAYDDQAAFSPDSSKLVFVTTRAGATSDLWTLDLQTKKAKPLTSGPGGDFRPSWSPDGKWIAFSSDRGSKLPMRKGAWEHMHMVDIYLIHPDGTGLKAISKQEDSGHGAFCGSPKWSADSTRVVAYCMSDEETWSYRQARPEKGDTRLLSIDIATGAATPVPAGPGVKMHPALLPSGEIAYVRKDIAAQGVFYGNGKPGPAGAVRNPSWSPDAKQIVYHRIDSTEPPDWQPTWSRDPAFELIFTRWMPAFHPSGERFLTNRRNGPLLIVESGTNASKPLFEEKDKTPMAAQWSPKGDSIIFGLGMWFTDRHRGAQVATINPDGSGFKQVTTGANNNGFPSLSPDGHRFVYRTVGPEGQGLRIKNLEDGSIATLTTEYDNFPLWSPRGNLIVFTRKHQGDFEIFSIRPDGKDLKRLTNAPGNEGHCTFSPDGEWVIFSSSRMGFKDETLYTDSPQPYGELFVMRFDGTQVKQLTDNQWEDATPAWKPTPTKKLSSSR